MNDKPATRKDIEEVVGVATKEILTAVGDQLSTVINHIDTVDEHISRLELKVENVTDDLQTRVSKLENQQA